MELNNRVYSFIGYCFPTIEHLICDGNVGVLLFTTYSQTSSTKSFFLYTHRACSHSYLSAYVSHFAFNFNLSLYFRFQQGTFFGAPLALSTLLKVAAYWTAPKPSSHYLCFSLCPLWDSTGNPIPHLSPQSCLIFQIFGGVLTVHVSDQLDSGQHESTFLTVLKKASSSLCLYHKRVFLEEY